MTKINLLKPNNDNLPLFLTLGGLFFAFGILDFYLNNFLSINITSFLPRIINFFVPLIFAKIRGTKKLIILGKKEVILMLKKLFK